MTFKIVETPATACDLRCLCGRLLARLVAGGVELRCRRCKRTLVVPLEEDERTARTPRP
jgi:phage FluMu protein Com